MRPKGLFILSFVAVILVGALHWAGSIFFLYWSINWFDSLMHYLGTMAVGFFFLWVWFVSGLFGRSTPSKKEVMVTALISVMTIAVGWEFFEFAYKLSYPAVNYVIDTYQDLLCGFFGAITVGLVGRVRSFYE